MRILVGLIAALALAQGAMACEGKQPKDCECDTKTNQWVQTTTNNYNNTTNNTVNGVNGNVISGSNSAATSASNSSATGGNASATGGTSSATGGSVANSGNSSATGGSVSGSGNSTNTNTQKQSMNNSGNSSSTSSIASGAVTNNNSATGGVSNSNATGGTGGVSNATGGQGGTSSASASGSGNGTNDTTVTYEAPKTYRAPVSTAYSASLTSGFDTCLGSASGGAQTQVLGITIGGTKVDKNCILIKQTQLLREVGQERASCFRMQMHKEGADIKEAMKEAGAECPPLVAPVPVVVTQPLPEQKYVTPEELNRAVKKAFQK